MKKKASFSVIIPVFNREQYIERSVMSVLNQTFNDLELIVVDDGSSDSTGDLVRSISDNRLTYLYQDNHGVSHARNRGLEKAKGDVLAFLDSDDYWVLNKLEITSKYLQQLPEISIFHTNEIWLRRGQVLPQKKKHAKPSGSVYTKALKTCCISISTAVMRKNVFETVGMFDESFEACEDYDFWLRATNLFQIKLIPEKLTVKHGGRPDQLSARIWGLDRFRIRALEKMLRSADLSPQDRSVTIAELEKKCILFAKGCEKRDKKLDAEYYRSLPAVLAKIR